MLFIKVQISRYVDAHFPGWVEFSMVDANGQPHVFIDKIPAITESHLDEFSSFPQPGLVACIALERKERDDGRQLVLIDTQSPFGIESTDGRTQFDVFSEQLCERPRDETVVEITQSR
jgi:hypothetical protein